MKSETNPKARIANAQNAGVVRLLRFEIGYSVIRACFGFRISDFELSRAEVA
jgi:hypothetical protein